MVRQFSYVHEVAEISLFSGKNAEYGSTIFLFQKQHQKPNLQNNSFYILRTGLVHVTTLFRVGS